MANVALSMASRVHSSRIIMNIDIKQLIHVTGGKGTGSAGGLVHSRGALPVNPNTPYVPLDFSEWYRRGFRG